MVTFTNIEAMSPTQRQDYYRRIAVSLYLCNGNMADAYRFYLLHTNPGEKLPKTYQKNAKNWLASMAVQKIINAMNEDLEEKKFLSYCRRKGLSVSEILQGVSHGSNKRNASNNETETIRAMLKDALENALQNAQANNDTTGIVAAAKEIANLMDAKFKQDQEADEKSKIIYFLPADVCEECPNRAELESKYDPDEEIETDTPSVSEAENEEQFKATKPVEEQSNIDFGDEDLENL